MCCLEALTSVRGHLFLVITHKDDELEILCTQFAFFAYLSSSHKFNKVRYPIPRTYTSWLIVHVYVSPS